MGFPEFYRKNMNAWIDCMTSLDHPEDGMTKVHAPKEGFLVLKLLNINNMIRVCPTAYEALVDGVAFVNWRKIEAGEPPVIALAYHADPNR